MTINPGTVSKILWHFPGGPEWDSSTLSQRTKPKSHAAGYKAFCGILNSRELRVGGFKEVAKVLVPLLKKYNDITKKPETLHNQWVHLQSQPVCCISDIPIAHLSYHALRFGKMAIGFHREAVIKAGFNPVLYVLHDSRLLQGIRNGLANLDEADIDALYGWAESALGELTALECEHGHEVDSTSAYFNVEEVMAASEAIASEVREAMNSFRKMLAFIKTFKIEEFDTIYCEREWRSISTFAFSIEDVAMLVLPKQGRVNYFQRFVEAATKDLPRSIPIVPWEDLIEH